MLLAALFIVGGLFRAVGASAIQFPGWGWTVFAGAVSVVLGIYLLANWSATIGEETELNSTNAEPS